MTYLGKTLTACVLAVSLWLSRSASLRSSAFGALALVGVLAWVAHTLSMGARLALLSACDLRELPLRREASWLAGGNALVALGLLEESRRLADPFWCKCAVVPGAIACLLVARLLLTRALHRSAFAAKRGRAIEPRRVSTPYISVAATASASASAAGSVSIRF